MCGVIRCIEKGAHCVPFFISLLSVCTDRIRILPRKPSMQPNRAIQLPLPSRERAGERGSYKALHPRSFHHQKYRLFNSSHKLQADLDANHCRFAYRRAPHFLCSRQRKSAKKRAPGSAGLLRRHRPPFTRQWHRARTDAASCLISAALASMPAHPATATRPSAGANGGPEF